MNVVILSQIEFEALMKRVDEILSILRKPVFDNPNEILDNEEFIKRMKVSRRTAQNWRDSGFISFTQIGRSIFYRNKDVEEFLNKFKIQAFARHRR